MADLIKSVTSKDEFNELIANESKLIVVDFYATWCGPCKLIGPKIEAMALEFKEVLFLKVDVDEAEEIAESCEISAMPTFQFYKGGAKIDAITGANEAKVRQLIESNK